MSSKSLRLRDLRANGGMWPRQRMAHLAAAAVDLQHRNGTGPSGDA